ncbi:GAF domain-containing protein [Streptomyces sp. NBC_01803]|uniref:GAF domain-containing protein n=1 Tax=Streptomyces sp. NBC_01803 TaxID=2975946 RepID=UPI002DDBD6F6|nr:GAF domain-containing protein [Streptomyces sp. NBC_01803]WSA43245.1 GAF domain-containing protein [Streptomyces sp. NBC_01803]
MLTITHDDAPRPLLTPEDQHVPSRIRRLRELGIGLGAEPVPAFDEAARALARVAGTPWAAVTFVDAHRQFFAGLHDPEGEARPRLTARDHGFCPYVVVRGKALVLDDVNDYPRFAGNPVVQEDGVRSYLGAPLLDPSGLALGTISVVDRMPRPWGRRGLETIKAAAAELTERILAAAPPGAADAD